jgi:hypothetical protein
LQILATHAEDVGDAYSLAGACVGDLGVAGNLAGEDAHVVHAPDVAVDDRLEDGARHRAVGVGIELKFGAAFGAGDAALVGGGHVATQRLHQPLQANVAGGGAAVDRRDGAVLDADVQPVAHLVEGQFLALKILHDQLVVGLSGGFDESGARGFRFGQEVGGNRRLFAFGAKIRLHFDQADDAFEGVSAADWNLEGHNFFIAQRRAHTLHGVGEIGVLTIHPVHEDDARLLQVA